MNSLLRWSLPLVGAVFQAGWVSGAELGDPAPALEVSEWIKGEAVALAEGKGEKVFVVEFWATWCPPCRTSIPHLTDLQDRFGGKGVVVVGMTEEESEVVKPFVEAMGTRMNYRVALDREGKTAENYMGRYGARGIPHAFVVDRESRVVWSGHPMDGLDTVLRELLSGGFDLERAKRKHQSRRLFQEYYELSATGAEPEKAEALGRKLKELDAAVGGLFAGERFDAAAVRRSARFEYLLGAYEEAYREGEDGERTRSMGEELKGVAPPGFDLEDFRLTLKLSQLFDAYYAAATEGRKTDSQALARQMAEVRTTNAIVLNDLAWTMLTDEEIQNREITAALTLAKRAYDASGGKDANIIDTYARALFDAGKKEEAVRYATKALELCSDEAREEFRATLERYRSAP